MKPTDEVDDLLAKAGAQWRASQPSPPEPDVDRITGGGNGPRRWIPVLAAASVAVIAVAALLVLPGKGKDAPTPAVAPGKEHPMQVRNGDKVEVTGQVLAAPGVPVVYCPPVYGTTNLTLPSNPKPPSCAPEQAVQLTGVNVDQLQDVRTEMGVRVGSAHLVGIWNDNKIAVEQQGPPVAEPTEATVPCPAPSGGWREGDPTSWITPALEAFVKARPDQLQNLWVGRPEGSTSGLETDPTSAPTGPSVVMIGVAHGDVEQIRQAVRALTPGNLCVTTVDVSQREADRLVAAVSALPNQDTWIQSVGGGVGDRPVLVETRIVDERVIAELRPIGLDKLDLRPHIKPVN
ncbi:MAG TPA: hypothetical protein VFG33_18170 [Kribbella sp.]|uniref:hypothetical protein n=1 Tax=Kribbella sp. TaxID=1871183 RepID=UPI002D78205B|nr:hypothetical protein [Kribbella sp.]HET6295317.1 hypothetical protein [Kribbella sp.]